MPKSSAPPGLRLIRGLGHSGSTILDLALGAHSSIVGLGEAVRVLKKPRMGESHKGSQQLRDALRFERRCTCGATAGTCPVWGPLLKSLAFTMTPLLPSVAAMNRRLVYSHGLLGSTWPAA